MDTVFEQHMITEAYTPSTDSKAWVAYLVLHRRYPKLTYWSWDGYHVHALADYSRDIVWRDKEIIKWSTKEVIHIVEDFNTSSTDYITNTWNNTAKQIKPS